MQGVIFLLINDLPKKANQQNDNYKQE